MAEAWRWFKMGFWCCCGAVAFLGVVQLLLWLLNQIFGHGPKLPW